MGIQINHQTRNDLIFIIIAGMLIMGAVGILWNIEPMGDDALLHLANIRNFAINFPYVSWDPYSFNGYSPTIGFGWTIFLPIAIFSGPEFNAVLTLHVAFIVYFLLLGISVYYFATTVKSHRLVALALPILMWSSNSYWNYSIWGASYGRAFSLPFMFTTLALTYEYVAFLNEGKAVQRKYWLVLSFWFMTFLTDVYIAIISVGIATIFLILSAGWKNFRLGLGRFAKIFLPVLGLTTWYLLPVAKQIQTISPLRNDLTPNELSQLFVSSSQGTSSLNVVYVPSVLVFAIVTLVIILKKRNTGPYLKHEQKAFLISLIAVSTYFFIMGWIPQLWPYVPRLMSTYDSNNAISFALIMMLSIMSGSFVQAHLPRLSTLSATFFFVFVIVIAFLIIPATRPVDWYPLSSTLNNALIKHVDLPSDYRISVSGRVATRWFPFFNPNWQQTGGRAYTLDQNIFYQSWYQSEVFFKDDLGSLPNIYLEDQPYKNVSAFLTEPDNFAEVNFWLDWFGAQYVMLLQNFYPLNNTVNNYLQRQSIFSTIEVPTRYGPLAIVRANYTSPILMATNAKILGFYSEQHDSLDQYNRLLALLSYLDLDSQYVVPIYLRSLEAVHAGSFDFLVTDSYTRQRENNAINMLSTEGVNVLVVSSSPGQIGFSPTTEKTGNGSLVELPVSLFQLLTLGRTGSYYFLTALPSLVNTTVTNLTSSSVYPSQNISLNSQSWTIASAQNAEGFMQTSSQGAIFGFLSKNSSAPSSLTIRADMPNAVLLSDQLMVDLSVKVSVTTLLKISFLSENPSLNYVSNEEVIPQGSWVKLRIPFTSFNTWQDPTLPFDMSKSLLINATTSHSYSGDIIQLANVSITTPGYSTINLPNPITLASNGFLEYSSSVLTNTSFIFSNQNGSASASPEFTSDSGYPDIIPLREFTSGAHQIYTKVIVVSDSSSVSLTISLFQEPLWLPVQYRWLNNQNLEVLGVPKGFKGLIWKETYTDRWLLSQDRNGSQTQSPGYQLAGPGFIYISLKDLPLGTLHIIYEVYNQSDMVALGIAFSTIVALVSLRKGLYSLGIQNKRYRQSRTSIKNENVVSQRRKEKLTLYNRNLMRVEDYVFSVGNDI
jgi:hypothetical protein